MAITASDVMTDSAALLNDASKVVFTDAIMLPYLRQAHEDLQNALAEHGVSFVDEISSTLTVAAGVKVLNESSTPALPSDVLEIIEISERAVGETDDDWVPMGRAGDFEQDREELDTLDEYAWREGEVKLVGATTSRELRIKYRKLLPTLSASGTTVPIRAAKSYLGKRTASYVAGCVGEDYDRAKFLEGQADKALESLINTAVKGEQDQPVRPQGYDWQS